MQVVDWAEHYKAVRSRIVGVKTPPQPRAAPATPARRGRHPSGRTLYGSPIGPVRFTGRDWLRIATPAAPSVGQAKRIMREICEKYGVTQIDLISDRRTANLVRPRQHACWRLRHETTLSYPSIGKLMGGRDHTTAIASVRRFEALIAAGKVTP